MMRQIAKKNENHKNSFSHIGKIGEKKEEEVKKNPSLVRHMTSDRGKKRQSDVKDEEKKNGRK